jgi:hypothetical protein
MYLYLPSTYALSEAAKVASRSNSCLPKFALIHSQYCVTPDAELRDKPVSFPPALLTIFSPCKSSKSNFTFHCRKDSRVTAVPRYFAFSFYPFAQKRTRER